MTASANGVILDVQNLARHYPMPGPGAVFKALDGVDLSVERGMIFGIVGESGCGKSTLARIVMALDRPTAGSVIFEGQDLFHVPARVLRRLRAGFQMVFQDPYGSLDPRQRVDRIVAEPLSLDPRARSGRVADVLASVGLRPKDGQKFPHEFSGGQRQRIAIARAIVSRPKLVVADEPVSALDLSVQAQILNLIMDLRDREQIAFLFISHSLAVVETIADRVGVMDRGRFVEIGPGELVLRHPLHPYSKRLVAAEPRIDRPRRPALAAVQRTPAPAGCAYADRCPHAIDRCQGEAPLLRLIETRHLVACHRAEDLG